ncbi:hypothetical protein SAMN04488121_103169 [Chitinophaga filiformis]|uniref:Uncharacterized protein n=1 Tax=Chitinophaga filiformis TaxID=104663 RepID=A0A1G7QRX9_CHIFI|nr:hypothetical protein SAMN04488121_103169 [Chitinophaga filiformis]
MFVSYIYVLSFILSDNTIGGSQKWGGLKLFDADYQKNLAPSKCVG